MIVGMDFGTTNSGISVYDGNRLQIIPLDPTNNNPVVARTALYITNDFQIYIGRSAINTYYEQNLNRPVRIERVWVGEVEMTFAELPSFVKDIYIDKDVLAPGRLFLSFKTGLASENYLGTVVGPHFYFLEDIIGLYLYVAKHRAETHLQQDIDTIVLGRPVRFALAEYPNQLAQERLLQAAFCAGYKRVFLQYEPIAAAHHYASTIDSEQNILIFDFGGGTLDLSVLRIGPNIEEILAIGGVPIAGDIFDQKLARQKLPRHFGEGTTYRAGNHQLPVPSSYYEAFSNWQDLLLLQRPDTLEALERIAQTARRPLQIHALQKLISSNYGLRMYDVIESVKRELSQSDRTAIKLNIDGFPVREPVTRQEFERIIRSDIRTIEAEIERVLGEASMKPNQIDAVIRTGGSSQIPAFIDLLEQHFGSNKVKSIDLFSSVTSGLGIIGHKINAGITDLRGYHADDWHRRSRDTQQQVAAVDLEVLKKFVNIQAADRLTHRDDLRISLTAQYQIMAEHADSQPVADIRAAIQVMNNDSILLITNDYLFIIKTTRQLLELNHLNVDIGEAEGFQQDDFEQEYICALMNWSQIRETSTFLLVTSAGYVKAFSGAVLRNRLEQPVSYRIGRQKGQPIALLGIVDAQQVLVIATTSGRIARIPVSSLLRFDGRLIRTTSTDVLQAAWCTDEDTAMIVLTPNGKIARISPAMLPLTDPGEDSGGIRPVPNLRIQALAPATTDLQIVTNRRIFDLDLEYVTLPPAPIAGLERGEQVRALLQVEH